MAKAFTGFTNRRSPGSAQVDWRKATVSTDGMVVRAFAFDSKDGVLYYPPKAGLLPEDLKKMGYKPSTPVLSGRRPTLHSQPFLAERYVTKKGILSAPIKVGDRYLTKEPEISPADGEAIVQGALETVKEVNGYSRDFQAQDFLFEHLARPMMGSDGPLPEDFLNELVYTGKTFVPASSGWLVDNMTGDPYGALFTIAVSNRSNRNPLPYRQAIAYYDEMNRCCNRCRDSLMPHFERAIMEAQKQGTPLSQAFQGERSTEWQNQTSIGLQQP